MRNVCRHFTLRCLPHLLFFVLLFPNPFGRAATLSEQASETVAELRSMYDDTQIRADRELMKRCRIASIRESGENVNNELPSSVTADLDEHQAAALSEFREALAWYPTIRTSKWNKTPSLISHIGFVTNSPNAEDATKDFMSFLTPWLGELLNFGEDDSLVLELNEKIVEGDNYAVATYRRFFQEIPVENNFVTIHMSIDSSINPERYTVSAVEISWYRDLEDELVWDSYTSLPSDITGALIEVFPNDLLEIDNIDLVWATSARDLLGKLTYKVSAYMRNGHYWIYVDAATNEVLRLDVETNGYSGQLNVGVLRPYEVCVGPTNCSGSKDCTSATKTNCHPMPFSAVYEDSGWYANVDRCSIIQTGSYSTFLGQTDYHGQFSLTPSDSSDTLWAIDGNKAALTIEPTAPPITKYFLDNTSNPPDDDDPFSCKFYSNFYATSPFVAYSNSTPDFLGFRNEMAYHINYAANYFKTTLYGTSVHEPVYGRYFRASGNDCICGGNTGNSHIEIHCGSLFENLANCGNEFQSYFRNVLFHEYGHSVFFKQGDHVNQDCYGARGGDASKDMVQEGAAMFSAQMLSSCETIGHKDIPVGSDRIWPTPIYEYNVQVYNRASAFTAIWLEYFLEMGSYAGYTIFNHLPLIDNSTKMIGSCSDSYDFDTCDGNSFYAHLMTKADVLWTSHSDQTYEVSRAFHKHVSDRYFAAPTEPTFANCSAGWIFDGGFPGASVFPYSDDATNMGWRAAIIPLESPSSVFSNMANYPIVDFVPDVYLDQKPWFTSVDDWDKYLFFGRQGETYYIDTRNLSAGTDTILDITNETGSSVLQCNPRYSDPCDNCYAGTYGSCTTFTPTTTGLYAIYLHPKFGSNVGPDATYEVAVRQNSDDYADSKGLANPGIIDGNLRVAYLNSTTDQDWTYFYLGTAMTVSYRLCGPNSSVMIISDAGGNLEQLILNESSCSNLHSVDLQPGVHYVSIYSASSTGYYLWSIHADQDLDFDSGATALDLGTDFSNAPGPFSRLKMIPTSFLDEMDNADWYAVTLPAGRRFQVFTQDLGSGVDTVIDLYAPSNTFYGYSNFDPPPDSYTFSIMRDDNGGAGSDGASRLEFVAPADNTYYIKISRAVGSSAGRYTASFYYYPGMNPLPTNP